MNVIQKKIVLMGNFSVGKTSLIRRFVENSFSDSYLTTIGVKISKKSLTIQNKNLMLLIWDIEGALDAIKRVNKSYLKGAHGAIIVDQIDGLDILQNLELHIEDLYSVNGEIPFVIALNKFDLNQTFIFDSTALQEKYPLMKGCYYTSAKSGRDIEKLFETLTLSLV